MTDSHNHLRPTIKKMLLDIERVRKEPDVALKVLDIGCGNGEFCTFLDRLGFKVVGVDESHEGIKIAQETSPHVKFIEKSIYELDETDFDGKFDIITSVEVIEHLAFPNKLLKKAKMLLKPEGYLILTTPYHGYVKNLALSILNRWDDHFAIDWFFGHLRFFSVRSLTKILKKEGFINCKFFFTGRFYPISKSMISVSRMSN